jgi:hypothetical protein
MTLTVQTNSERSEAPLPAQDLFSMAPLPATSTRGHPRRGGVRQVESRASAEPWKLSLGRACARAFALAVPAVLFRFPLWCVLLAVGAAVAGELIAWRPVRRCYWAVVLSAGLAEITSIFVSPFTWPLRFGFFLVLLGAGVYLYGTQTNDL